METTRAALKRHYPYEAGKKTESDFRSARQRASTPTPPKKENGAVVSSRLLHLGAFD